MRKLIILFLLIFLTSSFVFAAGPDGYITIPSLYLYKSVNFIPDSDPSNNSSYYDLTDLAYGIGHLEYTMWGNTTGGKTVLVGHTPGGFEALHSIQLGDEIILQMEGEAYSFRVFDIYWTHKDDNSVLNTPPPEFEVVLITCVDDVRRLIVRAK